MALESNMTTSSKKKRQKANALGAMGEQTAVEYLEEEGYLILERNYRAKRHEIDIIAYKDNEIAIVEVKTRSNNNITEPEEAVDHRKRQMLIWAADKYVCTHERQEPVRFDIISIVTNNGKTEIHHIKNAFNVLSY